MILGCLVIKFAWGPTNWKEKDKFILPINIEEISQKKRGIELLRALTKKKKKNLIHTKTLLSHTENPNSLIFFLLSRVIIHRQKKRETLTLRSVA